MKIHTETLLQELREMTIEHLAFAQSISNISEDNLNRRIEENSWSVLECLQHLNLYSAFYIPEITKRMDHNNEEPDTYFKSGILGNHFAKSMLPQENNQVKKMKTFKNMNPIHQSLDKKHVLDTFIEYQKQTLDILQKCASKNLTKIKTAISISNFIKLRLGDTLRVVIYHNLRHILQAKKVLETCQV